MKVDQKRMWKTFVVAETTMALVAGTVRRRRRADSPRRFQPDNEVGLQVDKWGQRKLTKLTWRSFVHRVPPCETSPAINAMGLKLA